MQKTVYNVHITTLVEKLKEIYITGCDYVNLTILDENLIKLNGIDREKQKKLPPPSEDILDYI